MRLLPTPTPEEVTGFRDLYERQFGVTLDLQQAQDILTGLMQFLYLTRVKPCDAMQGDDHPSIIQG